MGRRFLWLPLFAALTLAALPIAAAMAQAPTTAQDAERAYHQKIDATWELLNQVRHRQVRQDRILGFGFGITILLLIGTGLMILSRRRSSGAVPTLASTTTPFKSEAGVPQALTRRINPQALTRRINPQALTRRISAAWSTSVEALARVRLGAHQVAMARRQKRIRSLLLELEAQMAESNETNKHFREALESLVQETHRLEAESLSTARGRDNDPSSSSS